MANHVIVIIYLAVCVYAFYHFHTEYEQISIYRQGSYTREDFVMGLLVFLLVMELSRNAHSELFWVNMTMVIYTLWGYLSPIDFFWHPGTSFYRVVTSSTVELATGIYGQYAQIALTTIGAFLLLVLLYLWFKYVKKDPAADKDALFPNIRIMIETHAEMTSFLTLLLATLGIMVGLFTVTGFINRMGGIMLAVGQWHIIAIVAMAYFFGWLVGAGLPPTATYIVLAVITVEPMRKLGIDPWVAHFFVFLLAVWGELSPPTSLAAAVSARIAEASFVRTMYQALKLCLPVTLMTFAIFTRLHMVVSPGWKQVGDTLLVSVACWGVTYGIFGKIARTRSSNIIVRAAFVVASLVVMFHPSHTVSLLVAVIVVPAIFCGVMRHRKIAPPDREVQS